jgi:hypothetical protein
MTDRIGAMRTRVDIYRPAQTTPDIGGALGEPVLLAMRYGAIRVETGGAQAIAGQPVASADRLVTLWSDAITRTLGLDDELRFLGRRHRVVDTDIQPVNGRVVVRCQMLPGVA